jgi:hypothetical protein
MNLPNITQPVYEVKILSKEKPVKFRPFLVKEQKIMMMAVEAKDIETTIRSIKQIIKNCVLEPIDTDELPLADLETLFIHLRAKSMGEIMSLYYKCTNKLDGTDFQCGMIMEVPVNLMEVKQIDASLPKKIMVSDEIGVIMKYPSLDMIDKLLQSNDANAMFTVVASCIEKIFDKSQIYKTKDATTEEIITFVENLPTEPFNKLEEFVLKSPKSRYQTTQKCSKCGYEHNFILEGLSDFFT